MSRLARPIFVVGCPRSGTTLVQCILSASSQAFSLPETHFFSWVLPTLGGAYSDAVSADDVRRAREAFETEAELSLPPDFWAGLEARNELTALDVFLAVVEHFRPLPGPAVVEDLPSASELPVAEKFDAAPEEAAVEHSHPSPELADVGQFRPASVPAASDQFLLASELASELAVADQSQPAPGLPDVEEIRLATGLVDGEHLRPAREPQDVQEIPPAAELVVAPHLGAATELRVIEKTPRHVLCLDGIAEIFPDALFVNVVRDPIDVASSLQGVPFEASRSMLSHAQRWLESVQAAQSYAGRQPGRLHTLVYEELVREPEARVRELCTFVGLPYEPAMLEEFGREAARNVGRHEAWKREVTSGAIMDRKGVWRTRLTPGQAWLVAQSTRAARRAYGYVDSSGASAGSIAAALVREASVRYREARPSTGVVGAARHAGSVLKTLSAA